VKVAEVRIACILAIQFLLIFLSIEEAGGSQCSAIGGSRQAIFGQIEFEINRSKMSV
jgi:hypothetical protein